MKLNTTDPKILAWWDAKTEADKAREKANQLFDLARPENAPMIPPKNLRPFQTSDMREGLVIWHEHGDNGWVWNVVRHINSSVTYIGYDGCGYVCDDAYVEVLDA